MITLAGHKKFYGLRDTNLIWRANSIGRSSFNMVRWYCAVVMRDNLVFRVTRRKCHTASDALLYGARLTQRVNGFTDLTVDVMAQINEMPLVR